LCFGAKLNPSGTLPSNISEILIYIHRIDTSAFQHVVSSWHSSEEKKGCLPSQLLNQRPSVFQGHHVHSSLEASSSIAVGWHPTGQLECSDRCNLAILVRNSVLFPHLKNHKARTYLQETALLFGYDLASQCEKLVNATKWCHDSYYSPVCFPSRL
jgi:hypothetical protein